MIGIAPLPRDDDKALLSPEEQRKVDLKVHFNRNMSKSKSSSTCITKTFPTRCKCNFLPSALLIFVLYKEFPYVK